MLTDTWVITQLLAQFCALVLLLSAFYFSWQILRNWSINSNEELQLHLERRSYLIGAILQFVLFFQVISLLLFLNTVNSHFPNIIKGAMCATGVLNTNTLGYMVMYLKIFALPIYLSFLILNYLDNSEPAYPLTPLKYWFVFPAFVLVLFDLICLFYFYQSLKPDIIATCCSVDFIVASQSQSLFIGKGNYLNWGMSFFIFAFFYLNLALSFQLLQTKKRWLFGLFSTDSSMPLQAIIPSLSLIIGVGFVMTGIYTLKYFFVKYIYGLPSHNCLFDIFFPKYYYVGYVIYTAYFTLLFALFLPVIFTSVKSKLKTSHQNSLWKTNLLGLIALWIAFILPITYWFFWKGDLSI